MNQLKLPFVFVLSVDVVFDASLKQHSTLPKSEMNSTKNTKLNIFLIIIIVFFSKKFFILFKFFWYIIDNIN